MWIPDGPAQVDQHLWQFEVEQVKVTAHDSRLTTHDSGASRQRTIHRQGYGRKYRPVRDSKKQTCVGMTFLVSVSEGRSTLPASGSHVFGLVRADLPQCPPDRGGCKVLCGTWGVTAWGHRSSLGRLL
jgi:hypothetical protein